MTNNKRNNITGRKEGGRERKIGIYVEENRGDIAIENSFNLFFCFKEYKKKYIEM